MNEIYVNGQRVRLSQNKLIGQGGEAEIYDLGNGKALKVFKTPDHPDFQGNPVEQAIARERILEHQQKLKTFPKNLPHRIIAPEDLAFDSTTRQIAGYVMRYLKQTEVLIKYSDRSFREQRISQETVTKIFLDLYKTVSEAHRTGVVIGDFNDLNVLVSGNEAYLVDVDSYQFGKFLCKLFTERFVDPLLCDPKETRPVLAFPHNQNSDWYAFAIMLMQCLLYVGPYGGIYRPKKAPQKIVTQDSRPLKRITVFHPDVQYPKPAIRLDVLPDEMLEYLRLTFEKDQRRVFPENLIQSLCWKKCLVCGTEHARNSCPQCFKAIVKEIVHFKGHVSARDIFRTKGIILKAGLNGKNFLWLYYEDGCFKRENGAIVAREKLDPRMRFGISDGSTLIAKGDELYLFRTNQAPVKTNIGTFQNLPMFDANENHIYWIENNQLFRDGPFGKEAIGKILENQTIFWVGPEFGFGFYRAGNLTIAFVFDKEKLGINDQVKLPPIKGQLISCECFFDKERCWLLISTQQKGKIINDCVVILKNGAVECVAQATQDDGSWLGTLKGKCAFRQFLFAPTDEGIVRTEIEQGQIAKINHFPDTEPFVDKDSLLFTDQNGIYAVNRQDIKLLRID
ncbi:MAG: hypothetical protein WC242_03675 [Candidatus Paceibacterota bacterium]